MLSERSELFSQLTSHTHTQTVMPGTGNNEEAREQPIHAAECKPCTQQSNRMRVQNTRLCWDRGEVFALSLIRNDACFMCNSF